MKAVFITMKHQHHRELEKEKIDHILQKEN